MTYVVNPLMDRSTVEYLKLYQKVKMFARLMLMLPLAIPNNQIKQLTTSYICNASEKLEVIASSGLIVNEWC